MLCHKHSSFINKIFERRSQQFNARPTNSIRNVRLFVATEISRHRSCRSRRRARASVAIQWPKPGEPRLISFARFFRRQTIRLAPIGGRTAAAIRVARNFRAPWREIRVGRPANELLIVRVDGENPSEAPTAIPRSPPCTRRQTSVIWSAWATCVLEKSRVEILLYLYTA